MGTLHHFLCGHGIGKHENHWVRSPDANGESFEDVFKASWEKYPKIEGSFAEKVRLHSIHYDLENQRRFGS